MNVANAADASPHASLPEDIYGSNIGDLTWSCSMAAVTAVKTILVQSMPWTFQEFKMLFKTSLGNLSNILYATCFCWFRANLAKPSPIASPKASSELRRLFPLSSRSGPKYIRSSPTTKPPRRRDGGEFLQDAGRKRALLQTDSILSRKKSFTQNWNTDFECVRSQWMV